MCRDPLEPFNKAVDFFNDVGDALADIGRFPAEIVAQLNGFETWFNNNIKNPVEGAVNDVGNVANTIIDEVKDIPNDINNFGNELKTFATTEFDKLKSQAMDAADAFADQATSKINLVVNEATAVDP